MKQKRWKCEPWRNASSAWKRKTMWQPSAQRWPHVEQTLGPEACVVEMPRPKPQYNQAHTFSYSQECARLMTGRRTRRHMYGRAWRNSNVAKAFFALNGSAGGRKRTEEADDSCWWSTRNITCRMWSQPKRNLARRVSQHVMPSKGFGIQRSHSTGHVVPRSCADRQWCRRERGRAQDACRRQACTIRPRTRGEHPWLP